MNHCFGNEMKQNTDRPSLPMEGFLTSELLILPDGKILVHNLTQPFAELLKELNPDCEQISSRLTPPASRLTKP